MTNASDPADEPTPRGVPLGPLSSTPATNAPGPTRLGHYSRRAFIAGTAVGAAAGLATRADRWTMRNVASPTKPTYGPHGEELATLGSDTMATSMLTLRRPRDQLVIDVHLWNLAVSTAGGVAVLDKVEANKASQLVYVFGPQHVAEETFHDGDVDGFHSDDPDDAILPPPPVRSLLSGTSRIAFRVPESLLPLPFTTASLLDWLHLAPLVVPAAVVARPGTAKPGLAAPGPLRTALELPYRLVLSPPFEQAWSHALTPVDQGTGTRIELWHTRLGHREVDAGGVLSAVEGADPRRMVRAVWATDPDFVHSVQDTDASAVSETTPFPTTMNPRDRFQLVRLSADFKITRPNPASRFPKFNRIAYEPPPVQVRRLALSSAGGTLDSFFSTDLAADASFHSDLVQWRHLVNLGRDEQVRVVEKGWLFPFGMKAVHVQVSDRIFGPIGNDDAQPRGAYLRSRHYLVVVQPTRTYPTDHRSPYSGRAFPFASLECRTRVTPPLSEPSPYAPPLAAESVFQPRVDGTPFPFAFTGTDWAGTLHDFTAMAAFVADDIAYDGPDIGTIAGIYNGISPTDQATGEANPSDLAGRKVAYAPPHNPGDTAFVTRSMRFNAISAGLNDGSAPAPFSPGPPDTTVASRDAVGQDLAVHGIPRFFPSLRSGELSFTEVAAAGGADPGSTSFLTYYGTYLQSGFPDRAAAETDTSLPNRGEVLLHMADGHLPTTLGLGTKQSGGMIAPSLDVTAVSRHLGPTGDADSVANAMHKPNKILDETVKILGGIILIKILEAVVDFITADDDKKTEEANKKALQMTNERKDDPNRVETTITWTPILGSGPGNLNLFLALKGASCKIESLTVENLDDPSASTFDIHGELKNFAIALFGAKQQTANMTKPGDVAIDDADDLADDPGKTFILVPVKQLTFQAGQTKKEKVDVKLGKISFHGPLKYVEKLSELCSFGDGGGLKIDVDSDGIIITLTIAIPDITIGVLSITNMKVIAALDIPFDGSPVQFRFNFCTRDNPFVLRVYVFQGGGFIGLVLTTKGVMLLEFSFEFGGGFSFSFGSIASGKIEIKAGIYFKLETKIVDGEQSQEITLEAYLRLEGKVSILGLVNIHLLVELTLTYTQTTASDGSVEKLLVGDAVVSLSIEIVFFTIHANLHAHKVLSASHGGGSFGGGEGTGDAVKKPKKDDAKASSASAHAARAHASAADDGPPGLPSADDSFTFLTNYSRPQWGDYCHAFAVAQ